MSAQTLISRLDRVKKTGSGRWLACCPAHDDRHPSMTIRELEDGTVLLHCFSGCGVEQIIGSLGLDFSDLFPEKPVDRAPIRKPFNAHDVLEAIASETAFVQVFASNLARGVDVSDADRSRLNVAMSRIEQARELANG